MGTLWGRANSSNVMKVIWLMAELDVPYQRLDAGGAFGRTGDAEYLAMNPTRTVPTWQEDGFTLWESNAILRYLASLHGGGGPVWPNEPRARANIDRWMDWQQTNLTVPQSTVFQGLVRTPPEARDTAAIDAAIVRAGEVWSMLDKQLAGRDYVTGPDLTLADICSGVHVHRWFAFDIARPDTPHLRAWYDRLLARPAYREHCAAPMT